MDCRYSLEQSMFWAEIWKKKKKKKKYQIFFIWKVSFFGGKVFSMFEFEMVYPFLGTSTQDNANDHFALPLHAAFDIPTRVTILISPSFSISKLTNE